MRPGVVLLFLVACDPANPVLPPGDADGRLPPGRSCDTNEECESGWCVEMAAGFACAFLCPGGECDVGLCKRADGRDRDAPAICVPATSRLCHACTADTDCGPYGDLCLAIDDGLYCALDCSATLQCPEGYNCESFRDEQGREVSRQCMPSTGTCSCTGSNAGQTRACEWSKPGVGKCLGEESCQPGAGWLSCDAREPTYEECDDFDNDCDGLVDEQINGDPLQRACGYGPIPRRQECTGAEVCVDGIFAACSLQPPPDDEYICDGLDDDCDGEVDEGLLHGPEHCGACNQPCPPGSEYDASTVRTCVEDAGAHFCGPISCRVPHFDVDGADANGCEAEDDHEQVGTDIVLNDTWATAFPLDEGNDSCGGTACLYCEDGDWVGRSELRIPSDDRSHLPFAPPSPNADFYWFYVRAPQPNCWWSVDSHLCVEFAPGAGAQVEVCVSGAMGDPNSEPSFTTCDTVSLDAGGAINREIKDDTGSEYFYVRVRSLGSHYNGTYTIVVRDNGCP